MNDLECFITANGIKKKWLAEKLGVSPELLRHYMKRESLPPHLEKLALEALAELDANIVHYINVELTHDERKASKRKNKVKS